MSHYPMELGTFHSTIPIGCVFDTCSQSCRDMCLTFPWDRTTQTRAHAVDIPSADRDHRVISGHEEGLGVGGPALPLALLLLLFLLVVVLVLLVLEAADPGVLGAGGMKAGGGKEVRMR